MYLRPINFSTYTLYRYQNYLKNKKWVIHIHKKKKIRWVKHIKATHN